MCGMYRASGVLTLLKSERWCMREARNRFANLVKEAFEKAGRDPIDFASELKTAERREGFYALLAGDETPFAHHIAKAVAWRMSSSFDAELWATTFHEAYPSTDFKPMLIGANPELGMQVVMVIPDEADAMRLLEAMAANPDRRSKLIHVSEPVVALWWGQVWQTQLELQSGLSRAA